MSSSSSSTSSTSTFWGGIVTQVKPVIVSNTAARRLFLTNVTVGLGPPGWTSRKKRIFLFAKVGTNGQNIALCTVYAYQRGHVNLDLQFEEHEDVIFSTDGSSELHLAGYFARPENQNGNDHEKDSILPCDKGLSALEEKNEEMDGRDLAGSIGMDSIINEGLDIDTNDKHDKKDMEEEPAENGVKLSAQEEKESAERLGVTRDENDVIEEYVGANDENEQELAIQDKENSSKPCLMEKYGTDSTLIVEGQPPFLEGQSAALEEVNTMVEVKEATKKKKTKGKSILVDDSSSVLKEGQSMVLVEVQPIVKAKRKVKRKKNGGESIKIDEGKNEEKTVIENSVDAFENSILVEGLAELMPKKRKKTEAKIEANEVKKLRTEEADGKKL